MSKVKNGAIIGCGFFAINHINAWQKVHGVAIIALCDRDKLKAQSMADDFSVTKVYDDAKTMLETEDLDFVDIVTTVESHKFLVELVCSYGVPVICQKPIAETEEDAWSMVEAANKASIPLFVHENFRWQSGFILIKKFIDEKRLGDLHYARISFRHGWNIYKDQPYLANLDRHAILDTGMHLFDLSRFLMGEVKTMYCVAQRLNPIVRGEDAFTCLLENKNGTTSLCELSHFSKLDPEPFPNVAAWIEGSKATIELTPHARFFLYNEEKSEEFEIEPKNKYFWGDKRWRFVQESIIHFNNHVVEVLNGKSTPQPSGEYNMNTLRLVLAAYESVRINASIDMDKF